MVFSGILLNTNKNAITVNYLDPNTYSRNDVQTFQYSGTFIMSMNDASWDGSPPLERKYDTNSNITYTITTSSSGGTTTVYIAYQYINTFDPTSNTKVPGLRFIGKSYFNDINSNFTIIQFDNIPLSSDYQFYGGTQFTAILANDLPYMQKYGKLNQLFAPSYAIPKESREWAARLDTTNCTYINNHNLHYYNINLNGWNVNNDVTMETLLAAYNALEKMVELGYNPVSYNDQNFPDVPELQIYRAMYPNISTNGVTRTGGANMIESFNFILGGKTGWNNGRDPYVRNLLTWVFCNKGQRLLGVFRDANKANIAFMEPFLAPLLMSYLTNYYNWNNGFEPGEYWSLKDHKWSLAMCIYWQAMFINISGFAGDFAGIRAPGTTDCRDAFRNCSNFNSDLTDMILSWQSTNILIKDMITGSGLSLENYSKFLIAIKQSYDNNNSRFNYDYFSWNINQYYNSSASSARNALEAAFPGKITDLGLQ